MFKVAKYIYNEIPKDPHTAPFQTGFGLKEVVIFKQIISYNICPI